jgi:poly(3-hydroxybutyrate) depolymerase
VLRVVRIAGLNHAWSGGDPALRFNAEAGPDASRMMLEFFGRHQRRVT